MFSRKHEALVRAAVGMDEAGAAPEAETDAIKADHGLLDGYERLMVGGEPSTTQTRTSSKFSAT
ncbi:hypothetical protein [Oceaniglobus ichthyenteri]|uniref:hypothetical protein n=1 Tax=Oceaniglobus ichthyenteri TaxID=2136177 RepID=UPI000D39C172|nr:hypothetical protein [Oceaniglobus ichthyenteri]